MQSERTYIESNLLSSRCLPEGGLPLPPYFRMMTSPAFLALVAAHVGQNWGFYTLLTEAPSYLKNIQHFSLKEVRAPKLVDILSHVLNEHAA